MNYVEIARAFGIEIKDEKELESLYPYAPVFKVTAQGGVWVLKRSQKPISRARAIAAWTNHLAGQNIPAVRPAPGFGENPRAFQNEEGEEQVWVVYPFIDGYPYDGDLTQIRAAGELLGKIHAAGMKEDLGLKQRETVVTVEAEEIEGDIKKVPGFLQQAFPNQVEEAKSLLQRHTQRYFQQVSPRIATTRLPVTNCSYDYKASNLVYHHTGPVLVDPDNGGRIPRAYDLAIAALLFHNEGTGPARVFTTEEWKVFLEGYGGYIQLNELEISNWEDILLCAWIDEALWLLQDDESGWEDSKQSGLLKSLLFVDFDTLALPGTSPKETPS